MPSQPRGSPSSHTAVVERDTGRTMSRENVEIVRDQFAATNQGDFERVMRAWADDIVLVVPADTVAGGEFKGRDAVGRWFGQWFGSFAPGYLFEMEEARAVGDAVLVVAEHDARGRASGAAAQMRVAYLYWVLDEEIVRIEVFPDRAGALEAVGLSE